MNRTTLATLALIVGVAAFSSAQVPSDSLRAPKKTLYVVGLAHLDTQWRWHIRNTIEEYVPATLRDNFKLMDRYPHYVFTFEGAFKYMLMKEYYPQEYERLKSYIAKGQWRIGGSWVDAVDVNIPSFESLTRQCLYGNGYYKSEFGKTSRDVLLPDCFGFGFALPSIAAHCGLKSFSTQKLTWGSSVGVPFDIGIWEGVDGSTLVAGLNPGSYSAPIESDLTTDTAWTRMIDSDGKKSGLYAGYKYFGTGDIGGAPDSGSVAWLEKAQLKDGPIKVRSIGSDDLVDIASADTSVKLPRYRGELLMTRHGVGCYSSEAAMKRWNRKNEQLADAAERASIIGHHQGTMTYPRQSLKDTWIRFLWHQFHDDLTGTSIPEAYEYSWNDELLCQNLFSGMLEHAVEATTPQLDTRGKGVPLVVYNPLSIPREDIVEASVVFPGPAPKSVRVFNPLGKEIPAQVSSTSGDTAWIIFLAQAPSVGYAAYDVRPSESPAKSTMGLSVTPTSMENQRYTVTLNEKGDVASIYDKSAKRELLANSIRFQTLFDKPKRWPAWEIEYDDILAKPLDSIAHGVQTRIVENGPARVGIEVTRQTGRSSIRTVIRLAAGEAGDRLEFDNDVDWYERATLLKAAFPLTCPNDSVVYDIGLGTIKRGIDKPKLYEVPGQQWADMTARDNAYGVAILNDCKYGWDHPNDTTIRLTLIHTPGVFDDWAWVGDQKSMDNGHHKFTFAVQGHTGDWRDGGVAWQAARLNQPLIAFQTPSHEGTLGKEFSLATVGVVGTGKKPSSQGSLPQVMLNTIKLAEEGNEIIVRVRELAGRPAEGVRLSLSRPIIAAHQVNGVEESVGPAQLQDSALTFSLKPYQPKAFALTLAAARSASSARPEYQPLSLPFDLDGVSLDANRQDGDFDGSGNTLAGDLLPDTVVVHDVPLLLGSKAPKALNVVRCSGQSIPLPANTHNRLYAIAAAVGGPAVGKLTIGDRQTEVALPDYAMKLGQWNNRMVNGQFLEEPSQIAPSYINHTPVAWVGTHRHSSAGENEAYQFTYLYLLEFPISAGAKTITLPNEPRIRLLAMTAVNTRDDDVRACKPLYDEANGTVTTIAAERNTFLDSLRVSMNSPIPRAVVHYTMDGSNPTASSSVYDGPFTVAKTTTVRARAILAGANDNYISSTEFKKLTPRPPAAAAKLEPGLDAVYYEGDWSKLPNFDTVHVQKAFFADSIAIPSFARKEKYGLVMTGFVKVPTDGIYDFYLSSDDGSALAVNDTLLIDNDGLHGSGDVAGAIALKAGIHRLVVRMFQAGGDQDLKVSLAGPGIKKGPIPKEMLSHAAASRKR